VATFPPLVRTPPPQGALAVRPFSAHRRFLLPLPVLGAGASPDLPGIDGPSRPISRHRWSHRRTVDSGVGLSSRVFTSRAIHRTGVVGACSKASRYFRA